MANDIICQVCYDRYSKLLRTQRKKTDELNVQISRIAETEVNSPNPAGLQGGSPATQKMAPLIQDIPRSEVQKEEADSESRLLHKQRRNTIVVGIFLLGIGLPALAASVLLSSTILTFIGLGLTFWGALAFFVQPKEFVRADLMNASGISSLKAIDSMLLATGYRERGVYIRQHDFETDTDKAVVFVPAEPFSTIPQLSGFEDGGTVLKTPAGILVPPPGLALATLIEKKLGFKLKDCGAEALAEALPKVLVEDLEIVKDVEIEVKDDYVRFKLYESIYADFCYEARESSRRCALGCPMCSALASVLAVATGKPVLYHEEKMSEDRKVTESIYQLITAPRL